MNIYTLTDAAGVQHTLSGPTVLTQQQRIDTPQEAGTFGEPIGGYAPCAVQITYSDLDHYSDQLLARWKITRTVEPDPPAPVLRPELPKSTVVARLQDIGKFDAVWAILGSNAALFAKWFAPDWPNVYKDDPAMLQVFGAAGLTADQIATVTA